MYMSGKNALKLSHTCNLETKNVVSVSPDVICTKSESRTAAAVLPSVPGELSSSERVFFSCHLKTELRINMKLSVSITATY